MITGQGAYSRTEIREWCTPCTACAGDRESGGRIHTSTITVAIMPEAEEMDVAIWI